MVDPATTPIAGPLSMPILGQQSAILTHRPNDNVHHTLYLLSFVHRKDFRVDCLWYVSNHHLIASLAFGLCGIWKTTNPKRLRIRIMLLLMMMTMVMMMMMSSIPARRSSAIRAISDTCWSPRQRWLEGFYQRWLAGSDWPVVVIKGGQDPGKTKERVTTEKMFENEEKKEGMGGRWKGWNVETIKNGHPWHHHQFILHCRHLWIWNILFSEFNDRFEPVIS